MTIKELTNAIMKQADEKGFGTTPKDISVPEKIALIHSEVTEAYEAYRHNNMGGERHSFPEELCDIIQRTLHLAGIFDIDIEKEILKKIDVNKDRDWKWDKMNEKHS